MYKLGIFNIFKKKNKVPEITHWYFGAKADALKKLETLKNPELYEIVRNRENGKIAKGWLLKRK